jgi:uncharacterized repeat protein (TIGR01451 family)
MRLLMFCTCIVLLNSVFPQCTITTLGLDPATQRTVARGYDIGSGDVTVVMRPEPAGGFPSHTMIVSRNDASGAVIWQKRVSHTNPDFRFEPAGLVRTPDGGAFIYGDLVHGFQYGYGSLDYINQFAVKMDGQGGVEWARIYMMPDAVIDAEFYAGNRSEQGQGAVPLSNGGYAWVIQSLQATNRVTLDSLGLPTSAYVYHTPFNADEYKVTIRAVLQADGSFYGVSGGADQVTQTGFLDAFKVDQQGQAVWATRIENGLSMQGVFGYYWGMPTIEPWPGSVATTQNGDLLLAGESAVERVSSSGQLLWHSALPEWYWFPRALAELPNGRILFTDQNRLVEMLGDGSAISQTWDTDQPRSVRSANGLLAMILEPQNSDPQHTRIALSQSTATLSACGINTTANEVATLEPRTSYPATLVVDTTSIKTWYLSLADTTGLGLDILTGGGIGWCVPGHATTVLGGVINNSGTTSDAITVTLSLPSELAPITYSPAPTSIAGNVATWVLGGLPPDGSWSCTVTAQVPPNSALIGTTITGTITATQGAPETDLNNNTTTFDRVISGPYDPNNKLAKTSSGINDSIYFTGTDQWIDYTINFQNTGNAAAETVVVVDSLPAELRVGSFIPIGASHPYTYELGGNGVLRFIFNNINLLDSNTNEPASHGAVSFRIRPVTGLTPETLINNRADIFFDFNPAVRTADNHVWIDQATGIAQHSTPVKLQVFPVPVRERLMVALPPNFNARSARIIGADGRTLRSEKATATSGVLTMNVEGLAPQVCVLMIEDDDGQRMSARFVKE